MRRILALLVVGTTALVALPGLPRAQTEAKPIAFEVASIKVNKSGDGDGVGFRPGGLSATNVTVRDLILAAYRLQSFQMAGGPNWLASDRFDVIAKTDRAIPDEADGPPLQMFAMLRTLLQERFKLAVHTEARDTPIYKLGMAQSDGRMGSKLRRAAWECGAGAVVGPPPGGGCGLERARGSLTGQGVSIVQFADVLSQFVGLMVVDNTRLAGAFDLDLRWTPVRAAAASDAAGAGGPATDPGVSIFTAIQEQLGLKLESTTAPIDVLVVDHIEHPTPD